MASVYLPDIRALVNINRVASNRKRTRMPIIVFASSKGGVGKTTGALTLASVLIHYGVSTTLIDADPNTPLAVWARRFPESVPAGLKVTAVHRTDVADTIDSSTNQYVIVDLEGSRNEEV